MADKISCGGFFVDGETIVLDKETRTISAPGNGEGLTYAGGTLDANAKFNVTDEF